MVINQGLTDPTESTLCLEDCLQVRTGSRQEFLLLRNRQRPLRMLPFPHDCKLPPGDMVSGHAASGVAAQAETAIYNCLTVVSPLINQI